MLYRLVRGYEMRGKGKMGNPFSLYRSALKKVWGLGLFCFFAVLGFPGPVNADVRRAMNYIVSSDMSWYDYLHSDETPNYGGGRVLQAGDTLEIRNGATLTFDFENKEKMYRRFALAMTWDKLSESGPVVSEDISITGSGTIRGIGDKGLQGLYSTAVITVTDINLLFQDFFYGFYAKVDETTPKESVINVTNNITQLENVYCGMNAKNAAISLTTGTFTVAGGEIAVAAQGDAMVNVSAGTANLEAGFLVFARDSAQVNISADIANLEASYLVYTRDSAQATLTAQKAGTLQGHESCHRFPWRHGRMDRFFGQRRRGVSLGNARERQYLERETRVYGRHKLRTFRSYLTQSQWGHGFPRLGCGISEAQCRQS